LLRDELRAGIIPPAAEELASWEQFHSGAEEIALGGGRPIDEASATDYYHRNWGDASLDINGIEGGDAAQKRTIIPARARAKFSIRLAPGQNAVEIGNVTENLLRQAIPENADVDIDWDGVDAAAFDPTDPAFLLAAEALEETCGVPPALQRSGGSIPVLKDFYDRGIPTILSGFALSEDGVHAVDESFRLESLALCEAVSYKLYEKLALLPQA
jgi:acetylornithine deacetylase/succinyl-diaminopimelate desuccinylase-like protein